MIQKTGSSYPISHVGGMLQIRRSNAKVMRNAAPMVMTARLLRGRCAISSRVIWVSPKVVPPDARMVHVLAGSLVFLVFLGFLVLLVMAMIVGIAKSAMGKCWLVPA